MNTASKRQQRLATEPGWSNYQMAVFDWIENGSGHAQIDAVAGSGKSTSLLGIVNRIGCSRQPTAVLAFNRHVAEELRQKLGDRSGLTVSTCHSMGLSVLRRYFGGVEIKPNERKLHQICKKLMESFPLADRNDKESRQLTHETFDFLKETVRYSQLTLTEPSPDELAKMVDHFSLDIPSEPEYLDWALGKVPRALEIGEKLAADNLDISLDDLIWLPNRWDIRVPQKAFVLWDEAQDANQSMLQLCLRAVRDGGRLVAIGDPAQAIMGFAGSDADSWRHIQQILQPTVLPLSVCYRCPTAHLDLARRIVPQIEPRPGAIPGKTGTITQQDAKNNINPGDMVICRLTAPLIKLCLGLVIDGKKAFVRGRDLGKDLTNLIKKATQMGDYPDRFISALNEYCSPKIAFLKQDGEERKAESLQDRADAVQTCFLSFGLDCSSRDEFCNRIEGLFSDDVGGCVLLSTIHRAKGLEADVVFILKSDLLPYIHKADQEWQKRQEMNLTYVALTRAKHELYFIPSSTALLADPLGGIQLPESEEIENIDEWLTHENLQDMAETLAGCDFKMLAELRNILPAYALTAACKLLDPDTKARLKQWVLEQNVQQLEVSR